MIDLHVHSTASDGTFTPSELVAYAIEKKLTAFALSDHDTTTGLAEAQKAAQGTSLTIIPAVELSTDYKGTEIHVLGLYIDPDNQAFLAHLKHFANERQERNKKMVELLNKEGIPITLDELITQYPNAILTRAHFGKYLFEHGFVENLEEAFTRFLGVGCPCYVSRNTITPKEAFSIIKNAGGYPILAHPLLYHMNEAQLTAFIAQCKQDGLSGIEAIYSLHSKEDEAFLTALAKKYDLYITGGSDFHGKNKPTIDLGTGKGSLSIPDTLLTQFNKA